MFVLRRIAFGASIAVSAGCVLLLRHLALRDPTPFPRVEALLADRVGAFAGRMRFTHALDFAALALLAAALFAFALSWRGLALPSPAREVRLDGPENPFLARGAPARASLAMFAAAEGAVVVLVLRGSTPPVWIWAAGLLALVALARLADRGAPSRVAPGPAVRPAEIAGVLLVAGACAILAGHRLDGWEWAGSEDSYGFYGVAWKLYRGELRPPLLSPDGVYAIHPVASSWLQAALFPFLGATGNALRAGNLILVAGLAALGHAFARPLIGRAGAFATGALLGSSVLVQIYAKNGYNNLQGVFFAMLTLALASRAAATGRWTPLVLSGISAGAGLFSYALAAISGAAVILWLALSGRPSRRSLRAAAVFGIASLAAGTPCLLSEHYVRVHLVKLSAFSPELIAQGPDAAPLASRVLHALAQPVLNLDPRHAAAGPRLDPVSVLLLLVGFAALAGGAGARTASRALLALALFWPVAIGLLQPYSYPSSPWVLFATPAWAFLGGCGVAALGAAFPSRRAAELVALLAVAAAAAWSTSQVFGDALRLAPVRPLAFTVAAARAAGTSGVPATLIVPVRSGSDDAAPIEVAVAAADVPSVHAETLAYEDAGLRARLERLAARPAMLVLYEIGESFPPRDRVRELVRASWPRVIEVLYRSLDSPAAEPCVRVFVNARARPVLPFLPLRNRSGE